MMSLLCLNRGKFVEIGTSCSNQENQLKSYNLYNYMGGTYCGSAKVAF